MADWYILYNCELRAGYVVSTVFPKDFSNVKVTCNLGPKQEIGFYRRRMPMAKCQPLKDVLNKTGYLGFPEEPDDLPGTPAVAIGEGVEGEGPKVKSFALPTLPPAIVPFMDAMGPFMDEVRQEPYVVLAGSGKWAAASFKPDEELVLQLTFSNPGSAAIEIQNPAGVLLDDDLPSSLFVAKNAPDADVDEVQLTKRNYRQVFAPPAKAPPKVSQTLEILPGDRVTFEVTRKLRLTPGVYKTSMVFHSTQGKIHDDRAVKGALSMDLGILTIAK